MTELKPLPSAHNVENRKEWVLAHARTARARIHYLRAALNLASFEIDEIGIALKHDWINPDTAAEDLFFIAQRDPLLAACFPNVDTGTAAA